MKKCKTAFKRSKTRIILETIAFILLFLVFLITVIKSFSLFMISGRFDENTLIAFFLCGSLAIFGLCERLQPEEDFYIEDKGGEYLTIEFCNHMRILFSRRYIFECNKRRGQITIMTKDEIIVIPYHPEAKAYLEEHRRM